MPIFVEHVVRDSIDIWVCRCGAYWDIKDEVVARRHELETPPTPFYTIDEQAMETDRTPHD